MNYVEQQCTSTTFFVGRMEEIVSGDDAHDFIAIPIPVVQIIVHVSYMHALPTTRIKKHHAWQQK